MVACAGIDLLGNTIVLDLVDRHQLSRYWLVLSLVFTLPALPLIWRDLSQAKKAPRFSLSHGIFFVAALYRLPFKAARLDM